ncbi:ABC transporter ATP-binding protein [Flavihumibacter cheonanensis]|uniref:ABC transporter ATP-binding protein n=1 Tax=Flavihumibacter cheonanensis TaxID=1442385 RepID=UPI001EF89E91|nr:ATP-binding cassette domain-containing protein [Flavihumibacter cheonanensis]MCG7750762.1 ATP-binding cassette domain-containing protein [Flavihumibacter cheonanensis]
MEAAIIIQDLYKSFGSNHVLKGFNLELKRGENLAVLGKSGSGKSVLIKCIIGLMQQDEGEINVLGQSIRSLNQDELDHLRVKIGFLFQSNALYDSMTVRENLEFPLRRHWMEISNKETGDLVMESLENVGLAHTVDLMPAELSGGMRKRIALARTLILKPQIILYDEPTTGLDPITSKEISELMNELQKKYNTSSITISHDMNCIQRTADRVILLVDGIAYADGEFDQLKASTDPVILPYFE